MNEIIVGVGGKQCIFNFFLALIKSQVMKLLSLAPYWVSYTDIVELTSGSPVLINCGIEQSFKMTPQQLESSINKKTKIVVLNSPSNPTGSVYSKNELQDLS